jgi:formylglycine-generating enzyme required for sulfatase activity
MVWIPGGAFRMGSDHHYAEEAPARRVHVDGFWMDRSPVTNRQFEAFVRETGWKTVTERPVDPALYPDADPELLQPSSIVFVQPPRAGRPRDGEWWRYIPGADWRHPAGPNSGISGLEDHPVVHVAWDDVVAYAAWTGADLPTEAEWELASRGGLDGADYAWGDELTPEGRHMANVWQGPFPLFNELEDGWSRTSPVGTYPANGHGLYDMIGNTWEWTKDYWSTVAVGAASSPCCLPKNPQGGCAEASYDPGQSALKIPRRVLKGGSHLCAPNYCRRYRPAARHAQAEDSAASHIGFRCVVRP